MFEDLKKNIEQEKKIILDMRSIETSLETDKANEKFYISSLQSLTQQLRLLNKTVPDLLKEWSPFKKFIEEAERKVKKNVTSKGGKISSSLPVQKVSLDKAKAVAPNVPKVNEDVKKIIMAVEKPNLVKMSYVSPSSKGKNFITINEKDKKNFLENLKLSEGSLSRLKKMEEKKVVAVNTLKPSIFARYANKYFLKYSERLVPQFTSLEKDLKKSNMRFMLKTYLSMALFSSMIAFFMGFLIYGLLLVTNLSYFIHIWIPFVFAGAVIVGFYTYPASEAGSVQKRISQELPFVTIHMAAIAGSNIEPTKIFRIIASSKEYPTVGTEIRKIVAQIEIYGYDLVTSLKNVAGRTSSKDLSELFSGLATNISGGGELKNYLEKKAENFLLDYKLERQKYADLAGTFMDVYISILIAAPLILVMMLIVMEAANLGMESFGITTLLFLSLGGIIVANIIFLVVLNIKQPVV